MSFLPTASGDAGSFTVVLPELLRDRFERWLRREHLQMTESRGTGPSTYAVTPVGRQRQ